MDQIAISKFKATCLAVLEHVRKTGQPVRITRRGVPIAEIVPASPMVGRAWLGALAGSATLADDLVAPATDPSEWEALGP